MNWPLLVAACLLGWCVVAAVLAPLVCARLADRPMTHTEREALGWGGLAVVLALFLIAVLLIGARP